MRKEAAIASGIKLTGEEDFHYFLSIIFPDNNLKVLDYNRVLKTLCGNTEEQLMAKVKDRYTVEEIKGDPKPNKKYTHSMYLGKKWYSITIKPGIVDVTDPIKSLDVEVLSKNILKDACGIEDLRADKRIDFVGGIRGMAELERRCNEDCVCAFALYPVSIEEVMNVADSGKIMPPKSTWFEPKPRSGYVIHVIEKN